MKTELVSLEEFVYLGVKSIDLGLMCDLLFLQTIQTVLYIRMYTQVFVLNFLAGKHVIFFVHNCRQYVTSYSKSC